MAGNWGLSAWSTLAGPAVGLADPPNVMETGHMQRRRLADVIAFDQRRMAKHRLFETDRTITDLYCLDPDQEQLLLVHEASDKVVVAMAGRVLVRVEDDSAEIGQYEAVLVPAGAKHALKNLGPDPAVLLVFLAPRLA